MNPNPDETSPASGRQQSLEEIAKHAGWEIRNVLPMGNLKTPIWPIILRALQAATAESEDTARLDWLEANGFQRVDEDTCRQSLHVGLLGLTFNEGHNLRAAIDAARQQERSQG